MAGIGVSAGTGILRGRQTDSTGIGQSIADAAGYTGSTLGGIGRQFEASGMVLLGLLIAGVGLVIVGSMLLNRTAAGRGLRRAGRATTRAALAVAR